MKIKTLKFCILLFCLLLSSDMLARHRSMWEWSPSYPMSNQTGFINFCKAKDIRRVYIYLPYWEINGRAAALRTFIPAAHAEKIEVWVMEGTNPDLPNNNGPSELYATAQRMVTWNNSEAANAHFDGMMTDMEFHESGPGAPFYDGVPDSALTATQQNNRWNLLRGYLDTINGLKAILQPAGISLGGAFVSWGDDYFGQPMRVDWPAGGALKPFYEYSIALQDLSVIMAYNTNPNNVRIRVAGEIAFAATLDKAIEIGQETNCGQSSPVSWCGSAEAAFETAVKDIVLDWFDSCHFKGVMVHDRAGYWPLTGGDQTDSDVDGDGLPDHWEASNGLNTAANDAGQDPDGDTLTNLQEYQGDTDPMCFNAFGTPTRTRTPYIGPEPGPWPVLHNFDVNYEVNSSGGGQLAANDNGDGCGSSTSSGSLSHQAGDAGMGAGSARFVWNVGQQAVEPAGCGYQYSGMIMPLVNEQDLTPFTHLRFWAKSLSGAADMDVNIKGDVPDPCVGVGGSNRLSDTVTLTGGWVQYSLSFTSMDQIAGCPFFTGPGGNHLADAGSVEFVFGDANTSGTVLIDHVEFFFDPNTPTATPTPVNGAWPVVSNFNGNEIENNGPGTNFTYTVDEEGCPDPQSGTTINPYHSPTGSINGTGAGCMDINIQQHAACGYQFVSWNFPFDVAHDISGFDKLRFWVNPGSVTTLQVEISTSVKCVATGLDQKVQYTIPGLTSGWRIVEINLDGSNYTAKNRPPSNETACPWAGNYNLALASVTGISLIVDSPAPPLVATLCFDDIEFTGGVVPTSTYTATRTVSPTFTPAASFTSTRTRTPTLVNTSTYTATGTSTFTVTRTATRTNSPTVTTTSTSSFTATPTLTVTETSTYTPTVSPTFTDVPAGSTFTYTPTHTPTDTPTYTSTWTPTVSETHSPTSAWTSIATSTHSPTLTSTPTTTPSATPTLTVSETHSPTSTSTPMATPAATFTQSPVIATLTPTCACPAGPSILNLGTISGPTTGGTTVLVVGSNFQPGLSIWLGGVSVPAGDISWFGSTAIQFITPAHASGLVDLVITNPDLQSGLKPNAFTYVEPTPTSTLTPYIAPSSDLLIDDFSDDPLYNSTHNNDLGLYTDDEGSLPPTSVSGGSLSLQAPAAGTGYWYSTLKPPVSPALNISGFGAIGLDVNPASAGQSWEIYFEYEDGLGGKILVALPLDLAGVTVGSWTSLRIALSDFQSAGVDLARVISVGLQSTGTAGVLKIDNLGFFLSAALPLPTATFSPVILPLEEESRAVQLVRALAVPNPNPSEIHVLVEYGNAQAIKVEIFTKSMVKISTAEIPLTPRGWARVPINTTLIGELPNGLYYAQVSLTDREADPGKPVIAKFIILR